MKKPLVKSLAVSLVLGMMIYALNASANYGGENFGPDEIAANVCRPEFCAEFAEASTKLADEWSQKEIRYFYEADLIIERVKDRKEALTAFCSAYSSYSLVMQRLSKASEKAWATKYENE